jgi:hypothetical protein
MDLHIEKKDYRAADEVKYLIQVKVTLARWEHVTKVAKIPPNH